MRNLKRALSLGLTAAMISGLMVMGSSAASYADVTSEDNQEAIEVLQAVEIMVGDENGDFNPDQNVTRNEMAVIMANLMEYNVASYKNTSPFTDVPAWAEPYVAACWTNGITAGYSDTIYGGSDTVTTAQAALMLMKALGYFQYASDFGGDWQLATTRQGNNIDLFVGVDSGVTQAMTRNDVAQLVLNTLKSGTVEASTDGSWTIGDVTINNNVTYSYITSNQTYATAIDDARSTSNTTDAGKSIVELGEQLYMGDLKLNDNTTDVFGRPARYWEYDGKEIGTYAKRELLKQSYTAEVSSKDLYDLLGKSTLTDYTMDVYIDGEDDVKVNSDIFTASDISKNDKTAIGGTGNGVLTEVYVDTDEKQVDIAIINTYLAIAEDDYNEKKEEASFEVHNLDKQKDELIKADKSSVKNVEVALEDFEIVKDVVDGEAYLVNVAEGEVQAIAKAEVISDTEITAFKKGSNVTVDGTKYSYAETADYDVEVLDNYTSSDTGTINLKDLTYNVYLDKYGYAIGVDLVETPNNYLFITGVDTSESALGNKTAKASAIFLDGTMETIDINWSKSDIDADIQNNTYDAILNIWCTYTVNNNGVYTVKKVVEATDDTTIPGGTNNDSKVAQYNQTTTVDSDKPGALEINKKNIALDGRPNAGRFSSVYGNDATIYLTAELAEIEYKGHEVGIIDDVANVTTGVKNANLTVWSNVEASKEADEDTNPASNPLYHAAGVYTLYKSNGYIIAAVVVGEDDAASKNLVYTHTDSVEQESYDKATDEWTWTRKVVMNGEEVTLTEISDDSTYLESMAPNTWYEVKLNAEGNVIGRTPIAWAGTAGVADAEKYINEDIDIAPSVKAEDTVLYSEGIKADQLSMIGSTLYVKTTSETGFFVAEDVNIVLQQLNRKKMETTFDTGVDNLEDIVDSLNERYDNQKYDYTISAILEDGAATTVIIRDTADPYEPNEPSYTGDGTANGELVLDGLTGTVYQRKGDKKVDVLESIEEYFGVTNIDDLDTDGSGNYKVKVGNKTYTIADTAVELGEVTLVSQYAPNVAVTSATDVYLAKGESVTVTLYYAGGVLSQNNVNTAATNHAALKVTDGSLSRDQKTITLTLTATADFNADRTVQIQWS
ncbi:S-layer homology domain-containing protein [Pseudoflavonifractor capillosus]|uniref:S-layer homology domain-containing protein n=2 Tax=Pseudoflavonifractor capillosus TaxID=106588 RepID=UPI0019588067|nr:S-layer homology domain-containing protein [Pseudoflavonifractor capillosus]MBM6680972.1 S-layer homology domain-containing protein [Pseudoflavonifractor capillosus]